MTSAPVMSMSSSSGLTCVISLVLASTSRCASTARAPQIITASRCGALSVAGPRAAHRLAVQRDDRASRRRPARLSPGLSATRRTRRPQPAPSNRASTRRDVFRDGATRHAARRSRQAPSASRTSGGASDAHSLIAVTESAPASTAGTANASTTAAGAGSALTARFRAPPCRYFQQDHGNRAGQRRRHHRRRRFRRARQIWHPGNATGLPGQKRNLRQTTLLPEPRCQVTHDAPPQSDRNQTPRHTHGASVCENDHSPGPRATLRNLPSDAHPFVAEHVKGGLDAIMNEFQLDQAHAFYRASPIGQAAAVDCI